MPGYELLSFCLPVIFIHTDHLQLSLYHTGLLLFGFPVGALFFQLPCRLNESDIHV